MTNISGDPVKVLESDEKEKRKKYLKPCLIKQYITSLPSWSPPMVS
jgi:hypothetical protein